MGYWIDDDEIRVLFHTAYFCYLRSKYGNHHLRDSESARLGKVIGYKSAMNLLRPLVGQLARTSRATLIARFEALAGTRGCGRLEEQTGCEAAVRDILARLEEI